MFFFGIFFFQTLSLVEIANSVGPIFKIRIRYALSARSKIPICIRISRRRRVDACPRVVWPVERLSRRQADNAIAADTVSCLFGIPDEKFSFGRPCISIGQKEKLNNAAAERRTEKVAGSQNSSPTGA